MCVYDVERIQDNYLGVSMAVRHVDLNLCTFSSMATVASQCRQGTEARVGPWYKIIIVVL